LSLGRVNEFADLYEPDSGEPGQGEAERIRARLLLKTLIYPEGMGETFQVFIQHKGVALRQAQDHPEQAQSHPELAERVEAPRLTGLEPL